ncbi:hypothetical protein Dvina_20210 [Dactylosporangium vinaceum]|uniref:Uncharacterized protein n=1 Tax=Dactylosporangium vinaceum TaxID=53362 RepID=A0ABV5MTC1_9ACTN|nr:hypothetical protein [Dactylosporangium vinaceum]UAC00175.1 hypothetical protein Dvina_20210 [Dactylosporangium vinaceum]
MSPNTRQPGTGAYGLAEPTLADARAALAAVFGSEDGNAKWQHLLHGAGLTGAETDSAALSRLIAAMRGADPVTALCGQSLAIRLDSYTRLSATHDLLRSTP